MSPLPDPDSLSGSALHREKQAEQSAQEQIDQSTLISPPSQKSFPSENDSSATGAVLPVATKVSRFELRDELGRGAFGIVYRVWDPHLEREVALKVAKHSADAESEIVLRFLREARSAAQLRHPNIVPIYDAGRDGDTYYIAAGLVAGSTLKARIAKWPPLARHEVVKLVADVAQAVDYAHPSGIIHRDIKPANILVAADGSPQVADFGLARRDHESDMLRTMEGAHVGTPAYMSPEQASGRTRDISSLSDIWSVGVILYELLTGQRPFRGESVVPLLRSIIDHDPQRPRAIDPTIPRDLETACLKCLSKQPEHRYATSGELADDLERWLHGDPIRARRVPWAERTWRWIKRNPASTAALASLAAGIGFSSFFASQWRTQLSAAVSANGTILQQSQQLKSQSDRLQSTLNERNKAFDDLKLRLAENHFNQGVALCESGRIDRGMHHFARALTNVPAGNTKLEGTIRDNLNAWKQQLHVLSWTADATHRQDYSLFNRDGSRLLTADYRHLNVWDVGTGALKAITLRGNNTPLSAGFTADSRTIVAIDRGMPAQGTPPNQQPAIDARILFWDAETGAPRGEPFPCGTYAELAALSSDSSRAVTVTRNELTGATKGFTAQIWDVNGRRPIGGTLLMDGAVSIRLALSPDNRWVIASIQRSYIGGAEETQVWNLDSGEPQEIPIRKNNAWGVSLISNSPFVMIDDSAASSWNSRISRISDISDLKLESTNPPYPSGNRIRVAAIEMKGRLMGSMQERGSSAGLSSKFIRTWDLSRAIERQGFGQQLEGDQIEFSPASPKFIVIQGTHVSCWHLPGAAPRELRLPGSRSVRATAEEIVQWVETATCTKYSEEGGFEALDPVAWRDRRDHLVNRSLQSKLPASSAAKRRETP